MTAVPETTPPVDLTPFVPRVVVDWLRADPEARRRELEGTLAFVDISGFTALNERLAEKGKLGAEEVTEVMNRTFERLLDVAYAAGGGLLKFGGDALLLFFTGENHAARACDAAYGMRKALRELGRPQTSVGPVTLKMHVGIHADTFDFFLVGESHRELLLTGPGVTRTVEMESGAEAGEILVSDETCAALPKRTLGESKEGGRLLKAPPGAAAALAPLPPLDGLNLAACVPAQVRRIVEDGKAESEHRQAAVAFVHFGGVDDLLAEHGAERRGHRARRARHRRPARRGRARSHVPRDRHRHRRRQDDPRRGRPLDGGRGRGAHPPHCAWDRGPAHRARRCASAPAAAACSPARSAPGSGGRTRSSARRLRSQRG